MALKQYEMISVLGASILSVLLTISFVGIVPSETLAQGTNATNTTGSANATSTGAGGQKM
jgi:hypothetical protein